MKLPAPATTLWEPSGLWRNSGVDTVPSRIYSPHNIALNEMCNMRIFLRRHKLLLGVCPNVPPEQEKIMEPVDVVTGRQHQPRVDDLVVAGVCLCVRCRCYRQHSLGLVLSPRCRDGATHTSRAAQPENRPSLHPARDHLLVISLAQTCMPCLTLLGMQRIIPELRESVNSKRFFALQKA